MPLLSSNPMWETFGLRALQHAVYGGADFGECLTTMQRISDAGTRDEWFNAWVSTADEVAAAGDDSTSKGHAVSAREAYLRASTYYRTANFPLFGAPTDPRLAATFEKETRTFQKGAALYDPPIEVLEIPFESKTLPAYFVKIDGSGAPRKTIIHTNGYDSNIQEMYLAIAPAAIRRGYNCLLFDGPGQGRNLIRDGLTVRPDWENVVRPVIDYALGRPEVDPKQMVLMGWSFGGFLAPRAAAFEHRIAALVADPGQWDQRDNFIPALPLSAEQKAKFPDIDPALMEPMAAYLASPQSDPLLRWKLLQRGLWVNGVRTLFDYFVDMLRFEVSSVASRIACPTLLTAPEGDPIAVGATKLYEALTVGNKKLVRFNEVAGGHCEGQARTLYHQRVFDWLDETLARISSG